MRGVTSEAVVLLAGYVLMTGLAVLVLVAAVTA
jgi:hypothetical protein